MATRKRTNNTMVNKKKDIRTNKDIQNIYIKRSSNTNPLKQVTHVVLI